MGNCGGKYNCLHNFNSNLSSKYINIDKDLPFEINPITAKINQLISLNLEKMIIDQITPTFPLFEDLPE